MVLGLSGCLVLGMVVMNDHARSALQTNKELASHSPSTLYISLLGGFHLVYGVHTLSADQIHLHKARDMLKLLALSPNQRLHREELLEMLWPEHAPQQAAHNLSQTLYTLRPKLKALDASIRLDFEDECLNLKAPDGITSDVEDFEQAARSVLGYTGRITTQATANCHEAILKYTGDLLPDDGPSDLFYPRREQLRQMYIELLLLFAHYSLELKDYLPTIDALQKIIALDPAHEDAHMRLMRTFALNGQRQAAIRQYQILEEALRRELDVTPSPESTKIRDQILNGELVATRSLVLPEWLVRPHHNLPHIVSSFIGRDAEILQLRDLVQSHRLVTLTGAGGVGKTRLAFKVAEGLLENFQQGVYWVELASVSNPDMVASAVLDVFRLPEQTGCSETDLLLNFLRDRDLLLLLDNCEHLLNGCNALVDLLLNACPSLHILTTSRGRLNLPGEFTNYVPSLNTPEHSQSVPLTEIAQYDAVRLFVERSASYSPGFNLSTAIAPAVVQICQRLDGIPLALELAAARTRILTPDQIAARLDDVFHLLVGGSQAVLPRHRTLQASIEWSYALLSRQEQLLLQRLSVFAGGCTLEAAEVVCAGEKIKTIEILDLLSSLADQSLIYVKHLSEGVVRYYLLETIRQFAHQHLHESGALPNLHHRHLEYYLQLAEEGDQQIRGPHQLIWMKRLEKEKNNFSVAIERAFDSSTNVELGLQLVFSLSWFRYRTGDFFNHRNLIKKILSISKEKISTTMAAKLLFHAGFSSIWMGGCLSEKEITTSLEESISIWHQLGQQYIFEEAQCKLFLGFTQLFEYQKKDQGAQIINEVIRYFQKTDNVWWHAYALNLLLTTDLMIRDSEAALSILQNETILWKKTGDLWGQALPLWDYGLFYLIHGDFMTAQDFLQKSLDIFMKFKSFSISCRITRDLAKIAYTLQEYDRAKEYLNYGYHLANEVGYYGTCASIQCVQGFLSTHKGDAKNAILLLQDALSSAQKMDVIDIVLHCVAGYAFLNLFYGKFEIAVQLLSACYSHLEIKCGPQTPYKSIDIDPYLERCREQLEKDVFGQAWREGNTMSLDQAVQIAQESLNLIPADQKMI